MPEIKDFNAERRLRAQGERRFTLGAYMFRRKPSIPLSVITTFVSASAAIASTGGADTPEMVTNFEHTFLDCTEPICYVASDEAEETGIPTDMAWQELTTTGDEYGPVGLEDLANVVQWLVSGASGGPTAEPSASPDGSTTTGTNGTEPSASEVATPLPLTPAVP